MKAAVYHANGGPEVLSYQDMPDPVPGDGELLIAVDAISIEGGDLLHRRLVPPHRTPHIVGYAAAGRVIGLGAGVKGFSIGDRVTTFAPSGSHAERRVVRAEQAWPLAPNIDIKAAAAALVAFGTAQMALFDLGGLQAGQSVLVQGVGGGVGLAAVQLAVKAGARVIGTATRTETLDALRHFGLEEGLIDSEEQLAARVRAITDGRGVDVVIDPLGGAALQKGVDALTDGGRCVMVGLMDRSPHVVDAAKLMRTRKSLIGCMWGPLAQTAIVHAETEALLERIATADLIVPIDRTFSLSEAAHAHARAEERGRIGRVVMTP